MLKEGGLSPEIADYMIENCIGILPLPLALEEPSVIAACSVVAKLISEKGSGFICQSTPPVMIAQIQITEIKDYKDV
jgi:hydroxymethylglutaryl-CoA reductase